MLLPEAVRLAIPYAGITQIRFKGYLLSQNRRPLLYAHFVPRTPLEIKPDSVLPIAEYSCRDLTNHFAFGSIYV